MRIRKISYIARCCTYVYMLMMCVLIMYRVAVGQLFPQINCYPQPATCPPQYASCPPQPARYYPKSATAPHCPTGYQAYPHKPPTRPPRAIQYPRPTQV